MKKVPDTAARIPSMTSPRVRTIPANPQGRDFVVGDVHGCFRTLGRALVELRFDSDRDRLFGVGDLVNRGPHSIEAIDWLEHRFEAVTLGNHDRSALRSLEAALRQSNARPEEDWIRALKRSDYPRWLAALRQMPLALTIDTPHGPVGVVHAEPPDPDWTRATALLEAGANNDIDNALLGFEESTPNLDQTRKQPVEGLRALISGHFVVETVQITANRGNLDTGAGFANRNRLSLLAINARELTPDTFDVDENP